MIKDKPTIQELLLVLDTNTHIHYLPFTDIDWHKIFSAKRISLLIPLVILDELDHIKNEHRLSHIRKRAQAISNLLDKYIDKGVPEIRRGVNLEFVEEIATIDNLNLNYNDDKLIICVCSLINERNREIVLVTHDAGLTRRAKMRGLKTGKLPDDLKIEFIDESDKKYKELEQKHRKLEKSLPDLQLKFENEDQKIERTIQPPQPFPNFTNIIAYNTLKQEYDEKIKFCQTAIVQNKALKSSVDDSGDESGNIQLEISGKTEAELNRQLDQLNHQLRDVPQTEFVRFINESNQYLQNYWSYQEQRTAYQNFWQNVLEMKLVVFNEGLMPATEIEIELLLPENLRIAFLPISTFPAEPSEPLPPMTPRMGGEMVGEALKNVWNWVFQKKPLPANEPLRFVQPQFEESIKVIFSKDQKRLICQFKKLKHTQKMMLPPFYLLFNSYDAAQSFHFGFSLLADNTPVKTNGQMHVIIGKPLISPLLNFDGTLR